MFRIAPDKSTLPPETTAPAIPLPEATDVEPLESDSQPDLGVDSLAKVDQQKANYLGPDQGPFECSNCSFWQDGGACQVVSGKIDPKGVCQLFTSLQSGAGQSPEAPIEAPQEEMKDGQSNSGTL